MTYGELRNYVLQLLNQYSVAGTTVPATYNNQADYLARIPGLANDAITEIATTVRKIPVLVSLNTLWSEQVGDMTRFMMPEDFFQLQSGSVVRTIKGRYLHTNLYTLQGRVFLLVPTEELKEGDFDIVYYRQPQLLSAAPNDDDELDNVPETHVAVALYVAGQLAAFEDAYLSTKYINQYADRLSGMQPPITAEAHSADDVYGFSNPFLLY